MPVKQRAALIVPLNIDADSPIRPCVIPARLEAKTKGEPGRLAATWV